MLFKAEIAYYDFSFPSNLKVHSHGSVVFKAEAGKGGPFECSQLVDPACSVTFFLQAVPSLESHPAQTRDYEDSSFLLACKLAFLDSTNYCLPNL